MTRLCKIVLQELGHRNYSEGTTRCCLRPIADFAPTAIALRTSCAPNTSVNTAATQIFLQSCLGSILAGLAVSQI